MREFNQKQLEAIKSNEPEIVILAPAGSGKTTTLVGAIIEYKKNNPYSKVVAITFTKKAADDLQSRLIDFSGIRTSTIHSWAYSELELLAKKVREKDPNNAFKVKLLEEERIKEILNDLAAKRKYRYIKIWELYSYTMGNYNIDVSENMKRLFEVIKADYISYKMIYGLYDFTDLPQYLLDKLNDYDENIENIDALFVDEFQDVDDIQIELFERVPAAKKFYIGDPQQSIYIFRGATADVLKRLNDFKQHNLVINYRSYQEIIDFAATVQNKALQQTLNFASEKESMRSRIECIKGYGGDVYSLNASGIAFRINEYLKRDGKKVVKEFIDKNSMILCRKNKQVKAIKELGYNNVSTIHQAKGLEYPSVIVTNFDIGPEDIEEVNIAYVAMTRAENQLLVADYEALVDILEGLIPEYRKAHNLF